MDNVGEFSFQNPRQFGFLILAQAGSTTIEQVLIGIPITQRDPGRLSTNSHAMHLTNTVCGGDNLHQNSIPPCFLRSMVTLEDVNGLGRKVPIEANAFPHHTMVNSKYLSLRVHGLPPHDGAGCKLGSLCWQGECK